MCESVTKDCKKAFWHSSSILNQWMAVQKGTTLYMPLNLSWLLLFLLIWVCCMRDLTRQLVWTEDRKQQGAAKAIYEVKRDEDCKHTTHTHLYEPENIWSNDIKCWLFSFNLWTSGCTLTGWIFHCCTALSSIILWSHLTWLRTMVFKVGDLGGF